MQSFDGSIKPLPTGEINFSLPGIEKFTLNNNLEVYFIKKNNLPILQFNLLINAGSYLDPEAKKGLSNLFSLSVDEGAGEYSSLQLSDEFDILGSNFNVSSSEDNVFFSLQSLRENVNKSLELFSTVLKAPHFNEDDFKREQRKIITHILQRQDEPDEIADLVFDYIIFGKSSPYSSPIVGYDADVKNILIDDIKTFYSNFILPSNSKLIVVGDITRVELINKLEFSFKDWTGKGISNNIFFPKETRSSKIFLFDKKGSVQSEIRIGHYAPNRREEDFFPKTILNNILGGQFSSRINLNLRENKGYTYGANSRFTYLKKSAYFFVTTSVAAENTGNAVREIFNELISIRAGVKNEELDFAKTSLIRKFPSNFETNKQIASSLISMVTHSLPDNYFNSYINNIKSVSIDHVNGAAEKYIHPDKAITVIVGDKEKVLDQLKNLNHSEIIEVDNRGNEIMNII
ncbi:MAG: pitrilysin family protein [Ignavibacteriaceae bacterium]|jgi:zinc protease